VERTTLSLPTVLLKRLRRAAADRGISMAALIREAIEDKVGAQQPRQRSLGIGASFCADTAQRTAQVRPEPRPFR